MRKILLIGLLCGFCFSIFAQGLNSANKPALRNEVKELSPQMQSQYEAIKAQSVQNAQSLIPQTFNIDYEWYDSQNYNYYTSFIWNVNADFTTNDLVLTPNQYGVNDTLFWKFSQAATAFAWYNDSYAVDSYGYSDSITIDYSQATTVIDSIFYTFGYQNVSGLTAEIRTRVLGLDMNGAPDYSNVLWQDILQVDSSLTDVGYVDVRGIECGYALANAGDRFAIAVDITGGDKFTDEFFLIGGYGSPCNEDDPELSKFTPNSWWNWALSPEFGFDPDLAGFQPADAIFFDIDGNGFATPGNCERIFVQNWSIWTQVTVDAPFASTANVADAIVCPGEATVINAIATSGVEPYTYSWSPTTGLTSPTGSTSGVSISETTDYTVTVTDASGIVTTSDVTVVVDELSIDIANGAADCGDTDQVVPVITNPNSTSYTYSWTGLDAQTCCGDESDLSNLIQNFGAGTYSLNVNDGFCDVTEEVTIELSNSNLTASFTSEGTTGFEVEFTSTSTDANAIFWDFGNMTYGDGATATATYVAPGSYTVTITTVDATGDCTVEFSQVVNVTYIPVNIEESSLANTLDLFPNPAKNKLNINLESVQSEDVTIEIFNAQGQSLINEVAENGIFNSNIDVSTLANGIYLVNFKFTEGSLTKRITINR